MNGTMNDIVNDKNVHNLSVMNGTMNDIVNDKNVHNLVL